MGNPDLNTMSKASKSRITDPLEALLKAAVDAIVIIDIRGTILRFNPAAQKMFGYDEGATIGRNVSMLMPEPYRSQHDDYLRNYMNGGPAAIIGSGREALGVKSNGDRFPIHLSVGQTSETGRRKFVGIIRDLSAEKETEAMVRELETQLAHADRLVMLGELTAGIAHEINQPLTAIAAYADAGARLLDSAKIEADPKDLNSICLRVAEQARRAGDVVTRLRMMSRRGKLTKGHHDIRGLVTSVRALFEHELQNAGIALEHRSEADLPEVHVDEIQLQQVMVNLIKNSIDSLKAAGTADPRICIEVVRADGDLEFIVRDNGPGVPAEIENRLFEPFFTTKLRGVGLGLSICKNIAVAHGGNLHYRKGADGGAQFTLRLPLNYIG
jgi:two-component system sensor kinase FixL